MVAATIVPVKPVAPQEAVLLSKVAAVVTTLAMIRDMLRDALLLTKVGALSILSLSLTCVEIESCVLRSLLSPLTP